MTNTLKGRFLKERAQFASGGKDGYLQRRREHQERIFYEKAKRSNISDVVIVKGASSEISQRVRCADGMWFTVLANGDPLKFYGSDNSL